MPCKLRARASLWTAPFVARSGRWSLVAGRHGQVPRMAFGASNSSSMAISRAGYGCSGEEQCKLCVHDSTHTGESANVAFAALQAVAERDQSSGDPCDALRALDAEQDLLMRAAESAYGSEMTHSLRAAAAAVQPAWRGSLLGVRMCQMALLQHLSKQIAAAGSRMSLRRPSGRRIRPPARLSKRWTLCSAKHACETRSSSRAVRGK